MTPSPTATRILDAAEHLVGQRGFNAVSYADIAVELGVTKPSLHYHFASKAELGTALIDRYRDRFNASLSVIDATDQGAVAKLEGYAMLYLDVLRANRLCLCGMLAAEYQTLPGPMQVAVLAFFADNETWLQTVLEAGRDSDQLQFAGTSKDTARMIISFLEGAMLVARPFGDTARFEAASASLLDSLATTG